MSEAYAVAKAARVTNIGLGEDMRALRGSLIASVAMLPSLAQAQQSVTLGEISVVSTSPVGAGGGNSSPALNLDTAAQIAPTVPVAPGTVRLRGS